MLNGLGGSGGRWKLTRSLERPAIGVDRRSHQEKLITGENCRQQGERRPVGLNGISSAMSG